jgi:replicative DNA helicase
VTAVVPVHVSPTPPVYSPLDLCALYSGELDAIAEITATGRSRGPRTGLATLDRLLGGHLPPGLYVLHGEPGSGKSALAWQMAADAGCAALYVTTEMSALELTRRHVARRARKPRRSLLDNNYPISEEKRMADFATKEGCPYIIDACAIPASMAVLTLWLQMMRNLTQSTHQVCVIDSLHSWCAPFASESGLTEYDSLNAGIMALRELSSTYATVFLVLSERNRFSMQRGGMSAGAGTRRIEYGADVLMELSREDADKRREGSGVERIELKITKNRLGPAGAVVPLSFMGDTMTFSEVTLAYAS